MSKKKAARNARVLEQQLALRGVWGKALADVIVKTGMSQATVAELAETTASGLSRILHSHEVTSTDRQAQILEAMGKKIVGYTIVDIDEEREKEKMIVEITPAGCRCPHCDEPVADGRAMPHVTADGENKIGTWHRECLARIFIGSVGHQRRECGCYGGTYDDPPGMTRREAAIAAAKQAGVYRERATN